VGKGPVDAKKGIAELDDPLDVDHSDVSTGVVARPTVPPGFDLAEYAEESEIRERMPTITDEDALEIARQQSLPSNLPPPRRPMSTVPGPLVANPRDSSAEIDLGEQQFESLDAEEQIAILRAALAPLGRIPSLARPMAELGALLEDPKTAYVLGFVDGLLPLETIIEVTGLPELDTLAILDRMVAQAIVIFRPPPK
jgi:hypothetical protein